MPDNDQILSQNEVNAILEEVAKGRLKPSAKVENLKNDSAKKSQDYETYDLASQDRIIRGRMAGLEMINDRLNRYLQISLSSSLRKVVEVTLEHTELIKFGEFINRLVAPSCFNLVKLSPLRGVAIIAIESRLVFAMLSVYFGGQPDVEEKAEAYEQRDFTMVERNVIRRIVTLMLSDMQRAWHPVNPVIPSYLRTETNPQFIGVVPHADVVINTYFTVEFENVFGSFNIVIPYSMIEPIKARLSVSSHGEEVEMDTTWMTRLQDQLMKTNVDLSVELGRAAITIEELRDLRVGDVLQLNSPSTEPLVLRVENVPKMLGYPVVHRGNLALKIKDTKIPE